jgi:hypothetical protein
MSKIKAIQKGTGEEAIYFRTFKNNYEIENNVDRDYRVDEINQVLVDKEFKLDEYYNTIGRIQGYEYHGFKEGKLVFIMTNDNLTIWYD